MGVTHHTDLIQGSDEWVAARRGILTASEMKLIITPALKIASNDKERAHLYELLAQRITGHVEPSYVGYDMLRGREDEVDARMLYAMNYAPVEECGFITNDRFGFTIGFSPDGLVGADGFIECKGRRAKYQIETIVECAADESIPPEYLIQVQTALLVSERKWCDFISYSGGLPMTTTRVLPDVAMQTAIVNAAASFEKRLAEKWAEYRAFMMSGARLLPTERRVEMEITL